ncbi:hypothetical protein BpHYR1_010890 [Brachionus plicatilis]|uniref:Uncharacterized protein n=1 Tax=Brachionus plicatilis TaxID=10195 RepID=A0A3M7QW01_BRAPC|nr:hypothetical protein BpHYR1_010890 [Brachionus plicatilis]
MRVVYNYQIILVDSKSFFLKTDSCKKIFKYELKQSNSVTTLQTNLNYNPQQSGELNYLDRIHYFKISKFIVVTEWNRLAYLTISSLRHKNQNKAKKKINISLLSLLIEEKEKLIYEKNWIFQILNMNKHNHLVQLMSEIPNIVIDDLKVPEVLDPTELLNLSVVVFLSKIVVLFVNKADKLDSVFIFVVNRVDSNISSVIVSSNDVSLGSVFICVVFKPSSVLDNSKNVAIFVTPAAKV